MSVRSAMLALVGSTSRFESLMVSAMLCTDPETTYLLAEETRHSGADSFLSLR